MNEYEISQIVRQVIEKSGLSQATSSGGDVLIEASARHVHLTIEAVEALFGKGMRLTKKRELSQPGEFLSDQRVKLVTPKGEIVNVAVLGPERKAVQVELSATDCRQLGINAPVNLSGDLNGAGSVMIIGDKGFLDAKQSVIIAQNHIHMTPDDARRFGVSDGAHVKVRVNSQRPVRFEDVVIRVSPKFSLAMHIDFDEANACLLGKDTKGTVIL